jgi:hypothetical protein
MTPSRSTPSRLTPKRLTPSRLASLASWRRAGWWLVAALALAAGYADLARGGTTLAPILLVLGYCVLVPVAMLRA